MANAHHTYRVAWNEQGTYPSWRDYSEIEAARDKAGELLDRGVRRVEILDPEGNIVESHE